MFTILIYRWLLMLGHTSDPSTIDPQGSSVSERNFSAPSGDMGN